MSTRFGEERPRIPLHPGQRGRIANDVGVHANTLSGILTGSRRTTVSVAVRILKHPLVAPHGLTLEDLIHESIPAQVRIWPWETDDDVAKRRARLAAVEAETMPDSRQADLPLTGAAA